MADGQIVRRFARFLVAWAPKYLRKNAPQWGCVLQVSIKSACKGLVSHCRLHGGAKAFHCLHGATSIQLQVKHTATLCSSRLLCVQVSPEGKVLQMLMDPTGAHVASVAAVLDLGDRLILGNLGFDYLSVVPLSRESAAGSAEHGKVRQRGGLNEL